jgi:diguanylate cyclase (GGDEF)-like protein
LNEDGHRLHSRSQRTGRPYSVLFVDIDHFSHFNHINGDQVGDKALTAVAEVMQALCRAEDVVYRKGGEEFVILLPETRLEDAAIVAERVRSAVVERQIPHPGRADGQATLTVVVGVAESAQADADPADVWERAAGPVMALKRSERAPRNRVLINPSPPLRT